MARKRHISTVKQTQVKNMDNKENNLEWLTMQQVRYIIEQEFNINKPLYALYKYINVAKKDIHYNQTKENGQIKVTQKGLEFIKEIINQELILNKLKGKK